MGQSLLKERMNTTYPSETLPKLSPEIEHESFLKLRKTPFSNSVRVIDSPPLFLENINTTLTKLLSERMGGNKLFIEEDIQRLIETCLYGLAHLESNGEAYRDLNMDNIYYDSDEGVFKLLPSELIYETSYSLVIRGKKFRYLSPEMIIGLRMEEEDLEDEVLNRSNVFILGMILLEVCTLKSSSDCYDDDNFDIFDKVIQERLDLVRTLYPLKLVSLLSLMLEYDYMKRLTLQDLSIIVNQEVVAQSQREEQIQTIRKSQIVNQESKRSCGDKLTKPVHAGCYIPRTSKKPLQMISNKAVSQYHVQPPTTSIPLKSQRYSPSHPFSYPDQHSHHHDHLNYPYQMPSHQTPQTSAQRNTVPEYSIQQNEPLYAKQCPAPVSRPLPTPKNYTIPSTPPRQRKPSPQRQTMGGSKYPSIIYQTDFSTKQNHEDSTDFSLHRIKEEIERSRKRIQEFNRISPMELIEQQ